MTDRELVAAVAEHVMGWQVFREKRRWMVGIRGPESAIWRYSGNALDWDPLTDWNHMRDVVEKMEADAFSVRMDKPMGLPWRAGFDLLIVRDNESLPRAVLLAALAARGVEVPA